MNHRRLHGILALWVVVILLTVWTALPVLAQTEEPTAEPTPDVTADATADVTEEPVTTEEPAVTDEPGTTIEATAIIELDTSTDDETDACAFDLGAVRALLDEAEMTFASGDVEAAVALLKEARAEVDAVRAECQPVPDLIETSVGGVLTIGVPEGWATDPQDVDVSDSSLTFIMGTSTDAIDRTSTSSPNLSEGQTVIGVLWAGPDAISGLARVEGEINLDNVVLSLMSSFDGSSEAMTTEPVPLTVKDWRAQNFRVSVDGTNATAYVVELSRGTTYAIIIGLGEPLDQVDAVTRAVVDTLDYTAPVSGSSAPGSSTSGSALPTATAP